MGETACKGNLALDYINDFKRRCEAEASYAAPPVCPKVEVYANISDTLVGILMRARKRRRVAFESDMLFQGVHDNVVISVFKGV